MNDLINININPENSKQTVNARELHEFLEVTSRYNDWFNNRVKDYGFIEGVDFIVTKILVAKTHRKDHHISLDMAKELSMVERNKKGQEARRYFIECEKVALQTKTVYSIEDFARKVLEQGKLIESQQPAVEFCKTLAGTSDSIKIGDFAKLLCGKGFEIGQNRLFKFMRENNILMKDNKPYQKWLDCGYFEIVQGVVSSSTSGRIWSMTKITGKGQLALFTKLQKCYGKEA